MGLRQSRWQGQVWVLPGQRVCSGLSIFKYINSQHQETAGVRPAATPCHPTSFCIWPSPSLTSQGLEGTSPRPPAHQQHSGLCVNCSPHLNICSVVGGRLANPLSPFPVTEQRRNAPLPTLLGEGTLGWHPGTPKPFFLKLEGGWIRPNPATPGSGYRARSSTEQWATADPPRGAPCPYPEPLSQTGAAAPSVHRGPESRIPCHLPVPKQTL